MLPAAAVLSACGKSSAATATNGHEQLLTPSRPTPAAVVTVQLTGVTAADMPIGGGAAVLRRFTNGQWMTIYTLYGQVPGQPKPSPAYKQGDNYRDAGTAMGYPNELRFRLPDSLQPGLYRLERFYSYGASGDRTDLSLGTSFAVVAK